MTWKIEYQTTNEIQWGLSTNSSGVGSYIRYTKCNEGPLVRKWSGNSIGFPHASGYHGSKTFFYKKDAVAFVKKHIKKYPGYTRRGEIIDLDGKTKK